MKCSQVHFHFIRGPPKKEGRFYEGSPFVKTPFFLFLGASVALRFPSGGLPAEGSNPSSSTV